MDHRIPVGGAIVCLVLALLSIVSFGFLNARFEGPDPTKELRGRYELTARFSTSKGLPTKQPVLYKGISVGRVTAVERAPGGKGAIVHFTIGDKVTVREDAVVRVGELTLLGDAFMDLVSTGSPDSPPLPSGGEVKRTQTSVNFDEALDFLDARGRTAVRSLVNTISDGAAAVGSDERINQTVGGVTASVHELDALTSSLHGQENQIARLTQSASTVVSEIGRRERAVRDIVAGGRTTLDALAANTNSVARAIDELPRLLTVGRNTLADVRPLLVQARPLLGKLRKAAPLLRKATAAGGPFSLAQVNEDLLPIIRGLPRLRQVGVPVFDKLRLLVPKLQRLVAAATPAARNLVPMLAYLAPRAGQIGALYALLGSVAGGKDEDGRYYGRVGVAPDPAEVADTPLPANCDPASQNNSPNLGYCNNAYPKAGDGANPQPFSGTYPRLVPCTPPPRSRPKEPCR